MTEQNELYVKSQEFWQKQQEILIQSIEENLTNSINMVSIHTRMTDLLKETLEFEKLNLERNNKLFEEWKNNEL